MSLFLKSLLIGFAIAAPVGPIGLLCIRRSMIDGRLVGLVTGLGAATADAIFGLIAALGVSAITTLLLAHASLIQLVGGLFLVGLGLAMLRAKPATAAKADEVSLRAPASPPLIFPPSSSPSPTPPLSSPSSGYSPAWALASRPNPARSPP